jgi:hypothetical protein
LPFEALYNVFGPSGANKPENQGAASPAQTVPPSQGPSQSHEILISFGGGTAATAGTVSVTNVSTGTTITKQLLRNSTRQQCMEILQQAALQIQTQADGAGLRVFGFNNAVNLTQASVSISQF